MQKIFRTIQQRLAASMQFCCAHHIEHSVMFPYFRIPELRDIHSFRGFDHRIARIFFEGNTVFAPGDALCLFEPPAKIGNCCIHQEQLSVMFDRTAGKASSAIMVIVFFTWCQSKRKVFPVDKIITDRMSPMHTVPESTVRIALIKKVIFSLKPDQTIRIIHPSRLRHKMILLAHGSLLYLPAVHVRLSLSFLNILSHFTLGHSLTPFLLSFYCSGCHTLYNISLCCDRDDHYREAEQQRTRTHGTKIKIVCGQKSCKSYCESFSLGTGEQQ